MKKILHRTPLRAVVGTLTAVAMSGCGASNAGVSAGEARAPSHPARIQLPIVGYNYTDRYLAYFKVDSIGGGNVFVSSPTSGGGGSTCCAVYIKGTRAWKAQVEWQSGACRYNEHVQASGRPTFDLHRYFKKVTVDVDPRIPADPKQLEVHFYPDGSVQIALTEERSAPRLILPAERENKGPYPQCPNNEKPAAAS